MKMYVHESAEAMHHARSVVSFDDARTLAAEFGTPLLVGSRARLAELYAQLHAGLPGVELFYAVKANPDGEVLKTWHALGAGVDVGSAAEVAAAQAAGFTTSQMLHTRPCQSSRELAACLAAGVRWFTFDSLDELQKLTAAAPDAELMLRLAAPTDGSGISLSRLGATFHEAEQLVAESVARRARLTGLAFHIGSQATRPTDFGPSLRLTRRVWDAAQTAGCRLTTLDLGGGFPTPYAQPVPTLESYCRIVREQVAETFGDVQCRLIAEPGRALVAEAFTLVTSVIGRRQRQSAWHYTLDDGIYGTLSSIHYDRLTPRFLYEPSAQPTRPSLLYGPTCAPQDILATDLKLPPLNLGDLLLIPTQGAYAAARQTQFNGLPPTRVVFR